MTRNSLAPFKPPADGVEYPRAGLRLESDGSWKISFWDGPDLRHNPQIAIPRHFDHALAFGFCSLLIGTHRLAGTQLNGMAA